MFYNIPKAIEECKKCIKKTKSAWCIKMETEKRAKRPYFSVMPWPKDPRNNDMFQKEYTIHKTDGHSNWTCWTFSDAVYDDLINS